MQGQTERIPQKAVTGGALGYCRGIWCKTGGMSLLWRYQYRYGYGKGEVCKYHWCDMGFSPRQELVEHHADKIVDMPEEILEIAKRNSREC